MIMHGKPRHQHAWLPLHKPPTHGKDFALLLMEFSATSFDEDLGTLVSTTCQAQCNLNQNFVAQFICQPNSSSGDDDL
jgi:hypothetical protein